jgi:CubicO group peptidase (beta-lactamase class C family)
MGGHFMGYVAALQDSQGRLIAAVNYGWARTPCAPEGALAFSNDTHAPWGSVTKVITATAVMRKVQNRQNRSLDDPIVDYLPPAWRDEVSPPYRTLTIGDLIQHRGGFDKSGPVVNGKELSVRQRLAQDPPERGKGADGRFGRNYANINYALFDYMPTFLRPGAEVIPRPGTRTSGPPRRLSDQEYDERYHDQGARSHLTFLREQLFDRIGVEVGCNQTGHAGLKFARNYGGPNATDPGYLVSRDDHDGCAVGGIVMSPNGMLRFLHAVSLTDEIVDRKTWALMARPDEERCGWAQKPDVRPDLSQGGERNHGHAFGHNGSRWGGRSKAQVYVFPNGMSAVAVVNSEGTEGAPDLSDVLLEAYDTVLPDAR